MSFFKSKIVPKDPPIVKQIVEDMFAAVKLIVLPEHWCQRALCRNAAGERLFYPKDETAVAWDILGALHKVDACKETFTYLRITVKMMGFLDLDRFNDFVTHSMVLIFFKSGFRAMGQDFFIKLPDGTKIL